MQLHSRGSLRPLAIGIDALSLPSPSDFWIHDYNFDVVAKQRGDMHYMIQFLVSSLSMNQNFDVPFNSNESTLEKIWNFDWKD